MVAFKERSQQGTKNFADAVRYDTSEASEMVYAVTEASDQVMTEGARDETLILFLCYTERLSFVCHSGQHTGEALFCQSTESLRSVNITRIGSRYVISFTATRILPMRMLTESKTQVIPEP